MGFLAPTTGGLWFQREPYARRTAHAKSARGRSGPNFFEAHHDASSDSSDGHIVTEQLVDERVYTE